MSLLLISSLAITSCNDESEELSQANGKQLQINVGVTQPKSRAVITGAAMPDESIIGVTVVDNTGTAYQGQDYNNVSFTASKDVIPQTWTPSKEVMLSGEPATLYAYYPYQSTQNLDLSAIPMDMTEEDQKDWMWSTPITGLSDANHTATIKLNHALTNFKLTFYKENYSGRGEVTAFSLQSDGLATTGTLNAKTGAVTPTNDAALTKTVTYTLTDQENATHFDAMVIPTAEKGAVTVSVEVDGHTYSSTTTALTLAQGTAYNLTLKLTSTGLSVTSVSLTDWEEAELPEADFEAKLEWDDLPNGVYAVGPQGEPVTYENADESCIGVALIVTDADTPQRIMIEKNGEANTTSIKAAYEADGASNTGYTDFYWGPYGRDVGGIINWKEGNGSSILTDYKTWKNHSAYVWNDYNGKAKTEALMNVMDSDSYTTYANAATYCAKFNETKTENQGFSDWYIPACGQLALIYINVTDINAALTKIGGTTFSTSNIYWSSSEDSANYGWYVDVGSGYISWTSKCSHLRVRLVRNIQ